MISRTALIANALWLQLGWWACVLGAHQPAWLAAVVVGLLVHLLRCPDPKAERLAMLRVGVSGMLLDWSLGVLGLFDFGDSPLPLWLALLWLVFASGLRHSLAWAGKKPWLGALAGAVGGPLAYCAGAPLAGVSLPLGTLGTALVLAPLWAIGLPLAVRLADAQ
ncbi:membrane protein [Pseudomonas frederiksbergensis]|uniref:Membrane protein n=1 Tax=Pseudomonas frederiksbergensis TaxID=104087 RepID=A0A0B1Z5S3_9PSED|nr:membrane protein [Pseudomonas frederiksbergensis]